MNIDLNNVFETDGTLEFTGHVFIFFFIMQLTHLYILNINIHRKRAVGFWRAGFLSWAEKDEVGSKRRQFNVAWLHWSVNQ